MTGKIKKGFQEMRLVRPHFLRPEEEEIVFRCLLSGDVWKVFDTKHKEHILEFKTEKKTYEFLKQKID